MANVKITELPQVSSVSGTDILPTVASSATSKITITDLANSLPQVSSSISASYVSGSGAIITNLTSSNDALINGLRIGKGGGNLTNIVIGEGALANNVSGDFNVAIGKFALSASVSTDVAANIAIGYAALQVNASSNNVSIGWRSLVANTIGRYNVAVGTSALISNTSGSNNVSIGLQSLLYNTTGTGNTAIGYRAGHGVGATFNTSSNATGGNNIFIGNASVGVTGSDSNRTWIGNTSTTSTWLGGNLLLGQTSNFGPRLQVTGDASITGSLVVSQGITGSLFGTASWAISASWAPSAVQSDSSSYVSGSSAIVTNLTSSNDASINSTTVGRGGGNILTNTVLGNIALQSNTTGVQNTAIGYSSQNKTTTGTRNTTLGGNSLSNNTTGQYNIALGVGALLNPVDGDYNIGLGYVAASSFRTGSRNIFVGAATNAFQPGIITGSFNTIIGTAISGLSSTLNNNIILADGQGNIKYRWDETQNNIYGNLNLNGGSITGSNAIFTGTITAQTLQIQTVSSSIVYSSGSNIFGNSLDNTQTFTGSVNITGSLTVDGILYATASYVSGSGAIVTNLTSSLNASIGGINIGRGANFALGNTAIAATLPSASGTSNTAIGDTALNRLTTGRDNTAVGASALFRNTTGEQNVGVGAISFFQLTTGSRNVGIGNGSLRDLVSGSYNTAIGYFSGRGILTGSYNTIIGATESSLGITSLYNNVIIGDGQNNIRAWHNATSWSFSGSVVAPQGFTGSLEGTASYASNIYNSDGDLTSNRIIRSGSSYTLTLEPTLIFKNSVSEINSKSSFNEFSNTTSNTSASLSVYGNVNSVSESFKNINGITNTVNAVYDYDSGFFSSNGLITNLNIVGKQLTSRISGQAGLFTISRQGFSGSNDISENANNAMTGLRAGTSISGGPYISTSSFTSTATGILVNNVMLTGRTTTLYGIRVLDQISNFVSSTVSSSVVTNYYGIRLSNSVGTTSGGASGSVDNYYSIRIDSPTLGVTGRILNLYGIHAPGSTMNHYFAGNISIGTTETGSYKLHLVGNAGISGSLVVTGSVQITNVLTLPAQDPLPSGVATGSIAVSGSGVDCKPYFWNGSTWTSLI